MHPKFVVELELTMLDRSTETLEVWRLPNGALVGIDASYSDNVSDTIYDPYNEGETYDLAEELMPADAKVINVIL